MEKYINITKLYAESFYRKLVVILFDLKQEENQEADIELGDIQAMFNELKQKLLELNIRTNFPVIQYNDAFNTIKMIEELMLHIENIVSVLKILQMKQNDDLNDEQSELLSDILAWARDTLWKVRVVEGKLDGIIHYNLLRGRNHFYAIETYLDIKELITITEELVPCLKRFEELLKNLNINETLEFSLDLPIEYTKNYFMFLVVPASLLRKIKYYKKLNLYRCNLKLRNSCWMQLASFDTISTTKQRRFKI